MRCQFCVTDDAMSSMRHDQALHVLDQMARRGMDNVVLGGGEPFLWAPGVAGLAAASHARGFLVQVGTNGVSLPEAFPRLEGFDRYVLPVESVSADIHDRMRPFRTSHHAIILRRLDQLAAVGASVTVSTVVTARNIDGLPGLAAFLADYALSGARLHAWHLYQFIPEGRGGAAHADALQVDETEYDAACESLRDIVLTFRIFKRKDMRHSRTVDFFWYERDQLRIGSEVWGARAVREGASETSS